MTITQYDALQEVFNFGHKLKAHELNIGPATEKAILKRGWVKVVAGRMEVTDAGIAALEAL